MISIFHGSDEETHKNYQAWRKANVDGFPMSQSAAGQFTIHYTQDKRENSAGRGCMHNGVSDIGYLEDRDGCYTTARKVCSNSLTELKAWVTEHGFTTKNCKDCDSKRFPFPTNLFQGVASLPEASEPLTIPGWIAHAARLPEEVTVSGRLIEGSLCQVVVNAYERNPVARDRCIAHYGPSCAVCGFNFGAVYGPLAEGFIHVHHLKPLSEIGEEYEVDPVADLRPVCPNCHAVIHLGGGGRSIEEVRHHLRFGTTPNKLAAPSPEIEKEQGSNRSIDRGGLT